MKAFKLIIQAIGIFVMVFIAIGILPNLISNYKLTEYVKNEVAIYKDSDKEEYLKGLANVNDYVVQLDPLCTLNGSNGDSSYSFDLYLTTLTGKDAIDGIFVYINYVKLEGQDFNELALSVYYDKSIREVNSVRYSNLEHTIVTKESFIKGFYISDYHLNSGLAKIKGLQFSIKVNDKLSESNFILIGEADIDDEMLFKEPLDSKINLSEINLSGLISDSNNIPTDEEKNTYKLYYEEFDSGVINKYGEWTWTWYLIYVVLLSPIIYFGYIRGLIKIYKNKPKKETEGPLY